jgi:hypothetical protein
MTHADSVESEEQIDELLKKKEEEERTSAEVTEKKPKGKKVKTFNDLDEKFQLQTSHDPEHIFEEEKEMLKELRKRLPNLNFNDKFLLTFLFARRHNVHETEQLLKKFLKRRKELGYEKELPSFDGVVKPFLQGGQSFHLKGAHDKHDRQLFYFWIGQDNPKARDLQVALGWLFFEINYIISTESLKNIRNGEVVIIDFQGFGLRNVDLSSKGREFTNAVSGLTPKRVRKIYLVNVSAMLRLVLKIAKLVLPRKMTKRMHVVYDYSELKETIEDKYLHTMYGGSMSIDNVPEFYYKQLKDTEHLWKSGNVTP